MRKLLLCSFPCFRCLFNLEINTYPALFPNGLVNNTPSQSNQLKLHVRAQRSILRRNFVEQFYTQLNYYSTRRRPCTFPNILKSFKSTTSPLPSLLGNKQRLGMQVFAVKPEITLAKNHLNGCNSLWRTGRMRYLCTCGRSKTNTHTHTHTSKCCLMRVHCEFGRKTKQRQKIKVQFMWNPPATPPTHGSIAQNKSSVRRKTHHSSAVQSTE